MAQESQLEAGQLVADGGKERLKLVGRGGQAAVWQGRLLATDGDVAVRFHAGRGINGGIWPAPPEGRAMVTLNVEVDDVPEYVEKAIALGASIIMPHQKLPDGDEMAVILDPEGIPVGLLRSSQL